MSPWIDEKVGPFSSNKTLMAITHPTKKRHSSYTINRTHDQTCGGYGALSLSAGHTVCTWRSINY